MSTVLVWDEGDQRRARELDIRARAGETGLNALELIAENAWGDQVAAPHVLPPKATLLVPRSLPSEQVALLCEAGFPAITTEWLILGDSPQPSGAIDASSKDQGLILITSRLMARLATELGGMAEASSWIKHHVTVTGKPLAVMVARPHMDSDRLELTAPHTWSPAKRWDWLSKHSRDVVELFGAPYFRAMLPRDIASRLQEQLRKHEDANTTLEEADQELDEVQARLTAELRAKRPDLFDSEGEPREAALAKIVQVRTGKARLGRADIVRLFRKKSS